MKKHIINRTVNCSLLDEDVEQDITYGYSQPFGAIKVHKQFITAYCSGRSRCNTKDCQIIKGTGGTVYSEDLST